MPQPTTHRKRASLPTSTSASIPAPRPDDIAVVGVGCRFPGGVRGLDSLWNVLLNGVDVVDKVPPDRWDESFFHDDPRNPGTTYCREGGFLTDIDRFDADYFGISPREAREMDPQQRLLLEVTAEAMDDSGLPRQRWEGTRTSVHMGILGSDYLLVHTKAAGTRTIDPYFASGKEFSFAAGRISYVFGLHGPAMTVNTACSSSLVAVHLACQSLRNHEVDTALAGGVNAIVAPELTVFMGKVQALSPTGRCKPFDAAADGIVRGEGCGVVVLKRYADAVRSHDQIYGVIRGSAVNQDGRSAGLTVPNAVAQAALLRQALDSAGLDPRVPSYVEAHGTGTPLGDPLEISALAEVLGRERPAGRPLLVGSHKANFGHMDSAAGIAGFLKSLLVLRHRTVPPQIHHHQPSPLVDWASSGIAVPTEATELPTRRGHAVVGVSAFGLSGTNAHVLVSTPPAGRRTTHRAPSGPRTLLLSASTEEGLRELAADYRALLDGPVYSGTRPVDIDQALAAAALRRTHHRHRLAVVGEDTAALSAALTDFQEGRRRPSVFTAEADDRRPAPVVYVFSGQGSQWPGMARDLYREEPVARRALDECEALIREHAGWSLLDALADPDPDRLKATEVAQPAVFAVQVALARLWTSWGVKPDAVIGHSMGEVAAACVAGALSLPDAVRLIVARGRLMQRATGTGRMVNVEASAEDVRATLDERHPEVCVATVNGPRSVVVAGPGEAVDKAVAELRAGGASTIALPVDYAFHSPLMRPYGDELESLLGSLRPAEPGVRMVSTVAPDEPLPALDAQYWGRNLREPVLFWPAVDQVLAEGDAVFVEIGAHPVLGRPLQSAITERGRGGAVVGSLTRDKAAHTTLAHARARLHTAGVAVDWAALLRGPVRPAALPPHRWADERHWLSGVHRGQQSSGGFSAEGLSAQVRLFDAAGTLVGEIDAGAVATTATPRGTGANGTPVNGAAPNGTGPLSATPTVAPQAAAPAGPAAAPDQQAAVTAPWDREQLAAAVQGALATVLGHAPGKRLPVTRGFFELGIDSISVAELARQVEEAVGVPLDGADVLSHASVEALTDYLVTLDPPPRNAPGRRQAPDQPAGDAPAPEAGPQVTPRQDSGGVSERPAADVRTVEPAAPAAPAPADQPPAGPEPIAIVGIGCRLPGGADGPQAFWRLLSDRTDTTGPVPADRWNAAELLARGKVTPGTVATARGAFLDGVDGFDHGFFRVSPREARSMDPQQRLFLEVAWESLEDAGIRTELLRGGRTGVFVGLNTTDYQQLVTRDHNDVDLYYGTGNSFCGTAGRLSYFLGVRGPSIAVDTACSSSLTAIHLACQSLRAGESDLAVAGGANVMSTPTVFLAMSAAGALAPDGRCKTFDDSADGYGRGEGAGALVLKTLSRAVRDGDRVYAVIRGSAVNQDGASGGLTVPSGEAQEEVIRAALEQAGVPAEHVDYVEAHGTGTRLGDAIELRALAGALGSGRAPDRPLLVGSVKTNVGHLEAAAGVTGLIKTVLALNHQEIPAHLHVETPTRQVAWDRLPVRVVTDATAWPRGDRPRLAGISAFGFTGTNAHVVVEEPPAPVGRPAPQPGTGRPLVLTVSAVSAVALRAAAGRWGERVAAARDDELADLCWASGARRTHHEHRVAVVATTRRELADALAAVARSDTADGVVLGTGRPGEYRRLGFLYGDTVPDLPWAELLGAASPGSGDGGTARTLLGGSDAAAAFRAEVVDVDAALRDALGFSPVRAWETGTLPEPGSTQHEALVLAGQLTATALWSRLGMTPDTVAGHGVGEYAAAVAAGELTATEAVHRFAAGRGVGEPGGPGVLTRHAASAGWPAIGGLLAQDGVEVLLALGVGEPEAERVSAAFAGNGSEVRVLRLRGRGLDPLRTAAELQVHGCRVDWDGLLPQAHRMVTLPTYPWQRRSHWITPLAPAADPVTAPATTAPTDGGPLPSVNGAAPEATAPVPAPPVAAPPVPAGPPVSAQGAPGAADRPEDAAGRPVTPLVAELTALPAEARAERLLTTLLDLVAEVLGGADDVAPEQGFFELGVDSVLGAELKERAEDQLGRELPGTIMFECPNALSFAEFILDDLFGGAEPETGPPAAPGNAAPRPDGAGAAGTAASAGDGAASGAEDVAEGDDGLDDLSDDALMGRLLSALSSSEALLTEGD
ncbi:polyketide synthase type I [Wenjunlia vitaminophila]|uniref:Polyketide synthase type I n=1 Tax=Wenjunlia vitaminophila TaxID=76728 RepID=A0A0T6LU56_WENVI|nr:type I polyketide synthase [Wenjunlia vitaminophila]KRV49610.1 polyketide synthase type I [Wenjunlia vitaminophila]